MKLHEYYIQFKNWDSFIWARSLEDAQYIAKEIFYDNLKLIDTGETRIEYID